MFLACFASVLALPDSSLDPNPEYWYLCNGTLDGASICSQGGVGVYSSSNADSTRPTIAVASTSTVTFTKSYCTGTLGLSEYKTIHSGKMSGVFYPAKTGMYTFNVSLTHDYDSSYYLTYAYSALIDMDAVSLKGDLSCDYSTSGSCQQNGGYATCFYCTRTFTLTSGLAYPIYAGLLSNATISYNSNLTITLTYVEPSGSTTYYLSQSDTLVGYSGSSTSTGSNLTLSDFDSKKNAGLIAGVIVGCLAAVVLIGISIWLVIRKYGGIQELIGEEEEDIFSGGRRRSGRGSRSASGRRRSASGQRKSGSASRRRSGSGKRKSGSGRRRSSSARR